MNLQAFKNATPEQNNLWRYLSENPPAGLGIDTVTPLFFTGAIAGSEFLTYAAAKSYLALEFKIFSSGAPSGSFSLCQLTNKLNVVFSKVSNPIVYWDATAAGARYAPGPLILKNIHFFRISSSGDYDWIMFNGYRITYA